MDTLIDNRTFPLEMQEKPQPKVKKTTPWTLLILLAIAVLVIIFLVHRLFQKNETLKTVEEQKTTLKQQRNIADNFETFNPQLTVGQRQKKMEVFFNKN